MKAVILAGGKGTRLKPYTAVFPKPLMPIGDKPVLEIIILQLVEHGFNEIIMAVGHLAELIITFFGDGSKYGVRIKYSRENKPLGTIGPLALIKEDLNDTFLMMNGDVLTSLDYSKLVKYHRNNNTIATIALTKRSVKIDFGVTEVDSKGNIIKWIEKPSIDYLVSMGIYVFEPEILEYVKPNEYMDLPDLIKQLIVDGKVKGYISNDYWLDIGRPDDYEKANKEAKKWNKYVVEDNII